MPSRDYPNPTPISITGTTTPAGKSGTFNTQINITSPSLPICHKPQH